MREKTLIHCGTVLLPLGANITTFRWMRVPGGTPGAQHPREKPSQRLITLKKGYQPLCQHRRPCHDCTGERYIGSVGYDYGKKHAGGLGKTGELVQVLWDDHLSLGTALFGRQHHLWNEDRELSLAGISFRCTRTS